MAIQKLFHVAAVLFQGVAGLHAGRRKTRFRLKGALARVQELRFAEKMGEQYTVYRVYGAGSDDVSLASLRNLAQHLAEGSLGLFVG